MLSMYTKLLADVYDRHRHDDHMMQGPLRGQTQNPKQCSLHFLTTMPQLLIAPNDIYEEAPSTTAGIGRMINNAANDC